MGLTSHRLLMSLLLVSALVTGVTGLPVAAAQEDDSLDPALEGVFDSDGDGEVSTSEWLVGGLDGVRGWLAGLSARTGAGIASSLPDSVCQNVPVCPEEQSASDELAAVQTYYNGHNATFETYVTNRTNSTAEQTVEVTLVIDDAAATNYLLVNSTNSGIATQMVSTKPSNRTVTETVTVCGIGARNAREELETFHDEFAEPNKNVSTNYLGKMRAKYGESTDTTLVQSSGDCTIPGEL